MSQNQVNPNVSALQNQMLASATQAQLSQMSIANLPSDERSDRFRVMMKEDTGGENENAGEARRKDRRNRTRSEDLNPKSEESKKKKNDPTVGDAALAGLIQANQQQDGAADAAGMKGLFDEMLAASKKDLSLLAEPDFALQNNSNSVLLGAIDAGADISLTPAKNGELTTGLLAAASDLRAAQFRNILDYLVQTVSRARGSDDGLGMSLLLRQDMLPATELAVEAMRGLLQVTFVTESQASHTLLSSMLPNLEAILAAQFGDRSVNVTLKNAVPAQGADGNMPQENGNEFSQNQQQRG